MKKALCILLALMCWATAAFAETYSATARGFGGDVIVTIEYDGSEISSCEIDASCETESVGGAATNELADQVLKAQSNEIDGVSGATLTTNAVRDAVKDCIGQATGVVEEASAAADGVYTGTAMGFMSPIEVEVTMQDNAIVDIKVLSSNDTGMIGVAAANELCQSVVEHQSLAVDAVAGATVTSGGFITAVGEAIAASGADISAWKNVAVTKRAPETIEYDTQVVVIGGGMAGLSAAIEAAENGADVILLEKQGVFGGSTTRSEGFVMGAGTSYQKNLGIEDSAEDMFNDMYECYADEPTLDTALLRVTVDNSADLIDWLIAHGVVFETIVPISALEPRNDARAHVSWKSGDGLTEKLVDALRANDKITVFMSTPATDIIREDGAVVGVKATNNYGDDITIHADATILCAGSYGANMDLLNELNSNIIATAYTGCGDGDGWTLAENAGAKMQAIGYMAGTYMYFPYGYWDGEATLPGSPTKSYFNVIQVNGKGERLVNEDAFTFDYGDPLFDSGDTYGWAVVGKAFTDVHPDLFEAGQDDSYTINGKTYTIAYTADTLEELADLTDMDVETLKATVERYNASCDAGVDEEFGKDAQYLERVDAPYTAYMLTPIVSDGYSGCCITEKAEVIDAESGEAIPGFYAAGACALPQIIGNRYYGCGSLIMTSGVYGRIAGDSAMENIK